MRKPSEVVVGDTTLDKIIENHNHWIKQDCENWEKMKANLYGADLHNINLQNVNLSYACLQNACLEQSDLTNINLSYAILADATLRCTNLDGADLSNTILLDTDFFGARLRMAILEFANLTNASLENADLSYANLERATMHCTNFCSAILYYADLKYAYMYCTIFSNTCLENADMEFSNIINTTFYEANLHNIKSMPYIPMACPSDGEFIGWKKVRGYLVKLKIPASAKRSSAGSFKCRASKVKVLGIYTLDGKKTDLKSIDSNLSMYIYATKYVVGEYVYPDSFDENRWNECSNGIHFFINKQDAINY